MARFPCSLCYVDEFSQGRVAWVLRGPNVNVRNDRIIKYGFINHGSIRSSDSFSLLKVITDCAVTSVVVNWRPGYRHTLVGLSVVRLVSDIKQFFSQDQLSQYIIWQRCRHLSSGSQFCDWSEETSAKKHVLVGCSQLCQDDLICHVVNLFGAWCKLRVNC